jgi:hypothetical protein
MRILALLPLLASLGAPVLEPAVQPVAVVHADTSRTRLVEALDVLHDWDVRRARAWARADPDALSALYVRASGAGRADVRLLRAYGAHGLVVRRLVTQVFAVRVLHGSSTYLRLRVFDRVAGGEVVEDGHKARLDSSPPVTRTITFRLDAGNWRVAEVSGSGRAPRGAQLSRPSR